jgi:ribose transport system substrate-binding protein
MKKSLVALGLCLTLFMAAPVSAQPRDREIRLGVVTFTMMAPYFVAVVRAIEAEAQKHPNVRLIVADANRDVAKVTSDIEDLIARRVDGFIMNISPLEALPGPMAAIRKAGIPVVLVNRKLVGAEYNSWIGVDNFKTGEGVGEEIVKRMGGKGVLLMMRGGPADNSTGNARRDGVLSKVRGTGIQTVIAPEFGGWTEDGGFRVMEDMLAKHRVIDAVFCENDSMCLGALKAITDARRPTRIMIFGFDGQREALRQISLGGSYMATGLNSATMIGRMGFQRMMAILGGAKVEKDTIFPVKVITAENVAQYFDPKSIF